MIGGPRTAAGRADGDQIVLVADGVGRWTPWVGLGQVVDPGAAIGELEVLGVAQVVISGAVTAGRATAVTGATHHRAPVDHGTALVTIDPAAVVGATTAAEAGAGRAVTGGLTVRAPSSGRYYGRPGPDKPAFVTVGEIIRTGQTVCLLEVMKTFHRVTYGGVGLPDAIRVAAIAVADDADVGPGDVLVRLELLDPETEAVS